MTERQFTIAMSELRATRNQLFAAAFFAMLLTLVLSIFVFYQIHEESQTSQQIRIIEGRDLRDNPGTLGENQGLRQSSISQAF